MTSADFERAQRAVGNMVGCICRDAFPGQEDLTTLFLTFGDIVGGHSNPLPGAREKFLRLHQFSIGTTSAWRLDGPDRVVCSYDDKIPHEAYVRRALAELVGQRVVRAEFTAPAGDLAIHFERGQVVRTFCCIREDDHSCTWDYYFNGGEESFSVGPRGAVNFGWGRAEAVR